MTANSLYDSVEPLLVWRQVFLAVRTETLGSNLSEREPLSMIRFILSRFRTQEDEVKDIHLPIICSACLELLKVSVLPPSPFAY